MADKRVLHTFKITLNLPADLIPWCCQDNGRPQKFPVFSGPIPWFIWDEKEEPHVSLHD